MKKKEGIILNSIIYQENSKILYILSSDGIDSVLVRGAKKYKSGHINSTQVLTKVEYITTEKKLPVAVDLTVLDNYLIIKNDLKKMTLAEFILEMLYRSTLDNIDFGLLYKMIDYLLNEIINRTDLKLLLLQFQIKMLYFLGIMPNYRECIHCGTTNNLSGISIKHGSVECLIHESKDNIGVVKSKIIYHLYKDIFKITDLDNIVVDEILHDIDDFYQYHYFITFKSKVMINKIFYSAKD